MGDLEERKPCLAISISIRAPAALWNNAARPTHDPQGISCLKCTQCPRPSLPVFQLLCLSLSISFYIFLSLCLSLYLSFSLYLFLFCNIFSLPQSLALRLWSLNLALSPSLPFLSRLSVSLSLSLPISFSLLLFSSLVLWQPEFDAHRRLCEHSLI